LKAGDHLRIPAHLRHRVASVSDDALWLAVHF
jgi:cupin 2 domain-containing protein